MFLVKWLRKEKKVLDKEDFRMKLFAFFVIIVFMVFFIMSILIRNYEFVYYNFVLLGLILVIYFIHKRIRLHLPVFILVCVVVLMHTAGGVLYFGGTRLYDIVFGFIKYDNIIHFLSSFVVVLILYNLIYNFIPTPYKKHNLYLFIILVLMTTGFHTLIEGVEFFAVIFLSASEAVGDYFNNALDLMVNFLGAITASLIVIYYHQNKVFKGLVKGNDKNDL